MMPLTSAPTSTPTSHAHTQAVRTFARTVSIRLLLWSVRSMLRGGASSSRVHFYSGSISIMPCACRAAEDIRGRKPKAKAYDILWP